jgi:hypothetical protein
MKTRILIYIIPMLLLTYCRINRSNQQITRVDSDSLILHIDKFSGCKVETRGKIVHWCSVDGKKMKLLTESGAVIEIVPMDTLVNFDKSLNGKILSVYGTVKETRVSKSEIDQMEKKKDLLCHIDHLPCKDTEWVERKKSSGRADSLSRANIQNLRKIMNQTGKEYISVIYIIAEKWKPINP